MPLAFLTGDDLEGIIIRFENWNVYETLTDDGGVTIDPKVLKRPASQMHREVTTTANDVRRAARGTLSVPPLQANLRCYAQQPHVEQPASWREVWV